MKSGTVLYSSTDVRSVIIELFKSAKGRRVAVTAFVGRGAEAYLPNPEGIELVCWPKAGGTNPNVIRKLMKRGVRVYFADALHMKVYWTEDKGAVVASANLSTNALGSGNLREIGVYLSSPQVDIDRILRVTNPRSVSNKELQALDKLHHDYETKNWSANRKPSGISFSEWYQLPLRPDWRIGWWDADGDFSSTAKKIVREEYGIPTPYDFISCAANTYKKNDWILTFYLKKQSPRRINWLAVDYITPIPKSDSAYEREYPYQAVQVWPTNRYPSPPFRIDKRFRSALAIALNGIGKDKFMKDDPYKPSKRLIEGIYENY